MNRGLTLVEILVALAIILLLVGVGAPLLGNWPFRAQTSSASAQLVQTIRLTRERGLAGLNNHHQGIFFDDQGYTIFQGDNYASRLADYDVRIPLDKGLSLSWQLAGSVGGANEIVFDQAGLPGRTGKIIVTNPTGDLAEITVNQLGIVSFQSSQAN